MNRGDVFLVASPGGGDAKRARPFVVVSRSGLLASRYSTIMCAPVYSVRGGLSTEINVGMAEGLKHESAVRCDEVTTLPRAALTNRIGSLSASRFGELDRALAAGLETDPANLT